MAIAGVYTVDARNAGGNVTATQLFSTIALFPSYLFSNPALMLNSNAF